MAKCCLKFLLFKGDKLYIYCVFQMILMEEDYEFSFSLKNKVKRKLRFLNPENEKFARMTALVSEELTYQLLWI